jgi:hypothetical protein
MASFPAGWPPRPSSGVRSIRVFITGTTTANFTDNAYLFYNVVGANQVTPYPTFPPITNTPSWAVPVTDGTNLVSGSPMGNTMPTGTAIGGPNTGQATNIDSPMIWSNGIRVVNDGTNPLQFSFDGVNVAGVVKGGEDLYYYNRYEAGIALNSTGGGSAFRVEAW